MKLYFGNFCLQLTFELNQLDQLDHSGYSDHSRLLPYLSLYLPFTVPPQLMQSNLSSEVESTTSTRRESQDPIYIDLEYQVYSLADLSQLQMHARCELLYQRNDFLLFRDFVNQHLICAFDGLQGGFDGAIQVILQQYLAKRKGFLCHASSAIFSYSNQTLCMMITGESEAGKSTSVREGGFLEVLTDEMTIIDQIDGQYYAFASPFWSEGRTFEMKNIAHPLNIIAFPIKSNHVKLEMVSKAYAYFQLMQTITCYQLDPSDEHPKLELFYALDKLLSHVPLCGLLHFPKTGPWIQDLDLSGFT